MDGSRALGGAVSHMGTAFFLSRPPGGLRYATNTQRQGVRYLSVVSFQTVSLVIVEAWGACAHPRFHSSCYAVTVWRYTW